MGEGGAGADNDDTGVDTESGVDGEDDGIVDVRGGFALETGLEEPAGISSLFIGLSSLLFSFSLSPTVTVGLALA